MAKRDLLYCLSDGYSRTAEELRAAMDLSLSTVQIQLRSARRQQLVERRQDETQLRCVRYLYTLTQKGQDRLAYWRALEEEQEDG